jgi:iron complex outermembrane receptor protein
MKKSVIFIVILTLTSLGRISAENIEEITVTGSYITTDKENISVDLINEEDYKNLNITNIAEVSKYISSSSGSHFQSNTLDGVDQGMAAVTLRGLDHASTLVLLNSKRQTFAGTPSHEGEGYVDVNIIPEIALKRIEILKEGATSTYGSDAVAGVINFITQDDFIGTRINLGHQETSSYDQSDKTFGVLYGKEFNNSHIVIAANFLKRSPLSSSEIPRIAENGLSTLGNTFKIRGDDKINSGDYAGSYATGQWVADPSCENNGGVIAGPFCKFLYGTRFNVVNDEDHQKLYLSYLKENETLTYKLTAIKSSIDVNDNPQSPSYPALSFMSRNIDPGQGGSPFNVPVTWYGRPLGSAFPSPVSPKDIDQYHISNMIVYKLNDDTNIELSITQSEHKNFHNRPDTINSRFENAVLGYGGINGDLTWNIFQPLINSQELIDYIKGSEQSLRIGQLSSFDGIVRKTIGNSSMAFGFQYNHESLDITYNELARAEFNQSGQLIKSADLLFLGGGMNLSSSRSKKALFMELNREVNEKVNLLIASRFEKIDNDSSFDPKISLTYEPNEVLIFKGAFGTSFSSPSMAQLYSSEIALGGVRDVINGEEQSNSLFVRIAQVGNPNLKPSTSDNLNLGLKWDITKNLNILLDYWRIDYKDRLELEDPQAKILSNPSSSDITRNDFGDLIAVNTTFFNEEKTIVKGIDFSLKYFRTMDRNDLELGLNATYLLEFLTPEHAIEESDHMGNHKEHLIDRVGKFNYNAHTHSLPELRLNAFLGLTYGSIRYGLNARYIDGYSNSRPLPVAAINTGYKTNIDSFLVFDLGITKTIEFEDQELKVGLNFINLLDESAPLLYDSPDFSFDTRLHDPRGRLINFSVDYEF